MKTILVCGGLLAAPAFAQWFDYPHKGVPRTPDKPNLSAPVPHTADGKPDLAGVWLGDQWNPPGVCPILPAFTDGRELPKDFANPSWMGDSVGKWDGDEFVVDSAGFNDKVWNVDTAGHPHSGEMHVIERFRRVSYGHMEVNVTINDPQTYAKPWVFATMRYTLLPDADLLEFICEKNIDPEHMVGNSK